MPITRMLAAASAFPEKILTNKDLEKIVETNDQWIVERTGIRERHIVAPGQASSDLAVEAAKKVLAQVGEKPTEVEGIIVATVTPDMIAPSCACILQHKLGAPQAWAFDVNAACTGFVYALSVADQFIRAGKCRNILLVGVDVMSSIVDYKDRATCILFGDAAGAVFLEADDRGNSTRGILDTLLKADGSGAPYLCAPAGGSLHPTTHDTVEKREHYVRQDGKVVFKVAVTQMANVTDEILERNHFTGKDLDFFIPHQANLRIIEACGKRLGLKEEQVAVNIDRYGNTTAATIPTCLAELSEDNRMKPDNLILMAAFGAGFTYGSALVRWG